MSYKNPLINTITLGLSITRWNTFPRLQIYTSLDHIAFVCHVALTLASRITEDTSTTVRRGVLIREILFGGLFTFHYSDISSEVKYRLTQSHPDIMRELSDNLISHIESLGLHPRTVSDIRMTYAEASSEEKEIIAFSKAWASYHEVVNNSVVYPQAYSSLLGSMRERIPEKYLTYLALDTEKQGGTEQYLLTIHRLASSYRWNRMTRKYNVSVLSHLAIVAYITYFLGIESGYDDARIDTMLEIALFHDIPEAITGDIITPTKKAVPGLDIAIEGIESAMVDEYLIAPIAHHTFAMRYRELMLSPWATDEGREVKLADHLCALIEADIEREYSADFAERYDRIREKILEYKNPHIESIFGKI